MPRKRHVSRNTADFILPSIQIVMPRKRHVSRNPYMTQVREEVAHVMPRKRHVSRNFQLNHLY